MAHFLERRSSQIHRAHFLAFRFQSHRHNYFASNFIGNSNRVIHGYGPVHNLLHFRMYWIEHFWRFVQPLIRDRLRPNYFWIPSNSFQRDVSVLVTHTRYELHKSVLNLNDVHGILGCGHVSDDECAAVRKVHCRSIDCIP